MRGWLIKKSGDLKDEERVRANWELTTYFKESRIAQNYRFTDKVTQYTSNLDFEESYKIGNLRVGFRDDLSLYLRNSDKRLYMKIDSGKLGESLTYDHTRSAPSNNPGSPDTTNKFRNGGKGIRNGAKGPNGSKYANGILWVRVVLKN